MLRVLTEASGGLTSGYIMKAIKDAGFVAVASDVDEFIAGRYLADEFVKMPYASDELLWHKTIHAIKDYKIDVVIPSLDDTLLGWAERKNELSAQNIHVILSDRKTVEIFQDKWFTYQFFRDHDIPTPETSLEQKFPLVKPRLGRGSKGIRLTSDPVDMNGMISQQVVHGEEYTIDVLCDIDSTPLYIVPRKRLNVREGKATGGIVVLDEEMMDWVKRICTAIPFAGPINIQCFKCEDGSIQFIEINPRLAGGMALGFAATENWIEAIVNRWLYNKEIVPKPIKNGMKMLRYYDEIFVP